MLKLIQSAKLLFRLGNNEHHTVYACFSKQIRSLPVRFYSSATEETKNTELNIEELTQGDEELQQKFKVLLLEAEVMRQEGYNIPSSSFLKKSHWLELFKLRSRNARLKYLEFLFKSEKRRENEQIKKERKRLEREQQAQVNIEDTTDHLVYTLGHNHMFLRIYDGTINDLYNWKLLEAMKFGQKLVVDCGFDHHMTTRENLNCAKQLTLLFAENRAHEDPYDLHFCNINLNSILMSSLHGHINTIYEPWFPLSLHEKSYMEIFPKEQLIYLTPHCKEDMKTYDHDAIYIIGGVVDKANNDPISLAKAKEQGLRMAKFPLDQYLLWGSGSGKSLTLNQVIAILLDMKHTGDWKYALRHVPRRKLVKPEDETQNFRSNEGFSAKQFRTGNLNLSYNRGGRRQEEKENNRKRLRNVRSIFNDF